MAEWPNRGSAFSRANAGRQIMVDGRTQTRPEMGAHTPDTALAHAPTSMTTASAMPVRMKVSEHTQPLPELKGQAWAWLLGARDNCGRRDFSPNQRMRWTIGAHRDCDWCVHGDGVAPVHFELFWDGRVLWAQDRFRLGATWVGSRVLSGWLALVPRQLLTFGSCRMIAVCQTEGAVPSGPSQVEGPVCWPGDATESMATLATALP